jgi:phosphomannomutase
MSQERTYLARNIEKKFDDLNAVVGGQISIDIYPKGQNKSLIANDLKDEYELVFFGDKTMHGGNDYPLAMMIELGNLGKTHQVDGWESTRQILREVKK